MTYSDYRTEKLDKGKARLVVVVGPTASGKSKLAMRIAKNFNGELICADSRTIYKGINIGTAKPTPKDQKAVKHWGLDLIKPGQRYSAARFKDYAESTIADIQKRGKLPILVGGTGLYLDAVLFDYSFAKQSANPIYSLLPNAALQKIIAKKGWLMPENLKNRRHLLGTIRRRGEAGKRQENPRDGALIIGLMPSDELLKKRIALRAEEMFKMGVINEARTLFQTYGLKAFSGSDGIIYRIIASMFKGEISQDEAVELFKKADWQYARRQKTWFRRNEHIKWFSTPDQAYMLVKKQLSST